MEGSVSRGLAEKLYSSVRRKFSQNCCCVYSQRAWDKLEEEFKSSEKVRTVRLQTLSRDNLRLKKAEKVKNYTSRVVDVVNQFKLNGEKVSNKRVLQKVLMTLPERFDAVTTAIKHTKDVSSFSLTELICALLAYEQRQAIRAENSAEGAFTTKHKQRYSTQGEVVKRSSMMEKRGKKAAVANKE